jgi:hypothetical protein
VCSGAFFAPPIFRTFAEKVSGAAKTRLLILVKGGRAAVAGGHALADAVSPRWIAWPARLIPGVNS